MNLAYFSRPPLWHNLAAALVPSSSIYLGMFFYMHITLSKWLSTLDLYSQ